MVAVVAAVGCGQDLVLVCEDASIPAVTVVVRDSVSNAAIVRATMELRSGRKSV